ncbi:MAG TPA: FAD-binding oxidoreductase [Hyphomicrobiaceae bacterium]|nr:FAD-binding oxidoreductase [Hyphomicrobiaceae bacterium]
MTAPVRLEEGLLAELRAIVGAEHALTDPDQQLPYLREWRSLYEGHSSLVLRPGSTEEVAKILALANRHRIAVVPQAGNTGLVGGQIPMNGEILLSVARLNKVRAVDPQGFTMTVESGLTLAEAQTAADNANRLFPLSLPSEGTCRIGGNLGTNAGGVAVLAYGNTRQLVLGLEVVLADGRIWNGLNALKKDNTGYDLKDLFIGSEGTLGIITAAVLKLFPKPAEKATAMLALPELANAITLFSVAQEAAGQSLTAFEFIPRIVLEMVLRHVRNTRDPFSEAHPWYVLMEISGAKPDGSADRILAEILEAGLEKGLVIDARLAASLAQANDFWRLREGISEAQKPEGGNIKNDVSVPIARIPEFVARANAAVERLCPGARPLALGHFGDGNVHYNIAQPVGMPKEQFLARWKEISAAVYEIVLDFGGSISAEHGIGQMKRADLARAKGNVAMDMMRAIKGALDPNGILNPGKVL